MGLVFVLLLRMYWIVSWTLTAKIDYLKPPRKLLYIVEHPCNHLNACTRGHMMPLKELALLKIILPTSM